MNPRLTREGALALVLAVGFALAGLLRQAPPLLALGGGGLGLLLTQWVLGSVNVRGIVADRRLDAVPLAGLPCPARIGLDPGRRRWAAYDLWVADEQGGARFPVLLPGQILEAPGSVTWPRRGAAYLPPPRVRSRFPFGLMEHHAWIAPEAGPVAPLGWVAPTPRPPGPAGATGDGEGPRPGRAEGGSPAALRPWFPGEDPRRMHLWASLRRGRAVAVEWEGESAAIEVIPLPAPEDPDREARLEEAAGRVLRAWVESRPLRLGAGPTLVGPQARDQALLALARFPEGG